MDFKVGRYYVVKLDGKERVVQVMDKAGKKFIAIDVVSADVYTLSPDITSRPVTEIEQRLLDAFSMSEQNWKRYKKEGSNKI